MKERLIEIQKQIECVLELLKEVLGSNLLGVYLYGSSLVGGLQRYSDIDLLVVIGRKTTLKEKAFLVKNLLRISGLYMKDVKPPLEVTLVEKNAVNPWRYPPHFDFQYGEWLRTDFEKDCIEPFPTKEMPDLALIVTQVLLKSRTLWGEIPQKVFSNVPYHDFMEAMLHDIDRLFEELKSDTRNVLLTLVRIWSTVATNEIRSKPAAAQWACNHLPLHHQKPIERAFLICTGEGNEHWDDIEESIEPCARFIKDKIETQASLLDYSNQSNMIKITEDFLIKIRSYREEDAEELAKIYYNTIHNINCQDYTKEQLDVWAPQTALEVEGWKKKFKNTEPLVAIVDEKIVGFAEFERNGHIDCFYCHHAWIGRGIGSFLLKAIYRKALEYNLDKIFAEVSITAKPFFEKHGFRTICKQEIEKNGIKLTNFKMEKWIKV